LAIITTRWSPDTCGCILEYSWDDSVPDNSRVHTPTTIVNKCPAHSAIADTNTHFNVIIEENPRKNFALDEILQNAPSTSWFDIDPASGSRVFKNNITANWSWSGTAPNRVLTLTFTGITLTTAQRNTLQTRLNNRFGTGKITLA